MWNVVDNLIEANVFAVPADLLTQFLGELINIPTVRYLGTPPAESGALVKSNKPLGTRINMSLETSSKHNRLGGTGVSSYIASCKCILRVRSWYEAIVRSDPKSRATIDPTVCEENCSSNPKLKAILLFLCGTSCSRSG